MKIKKDAYQREPQMDQDILVKVGPLRLYFENYYEILSLIVDILTGSLYFIGSIFNFIGAPAIYGNTLFLLGGFFFVMRPVVKFFQNIHVYHHSTLKSKYEHQLDDEKFMEIKQEKESDQAEKED